MNLQVSVAITEIMKSTQTSETMANLPWLLWLSPTVAGCNRRDGRGRASRLSGTLTSLTYIIDTVTPICIICTPPPPPAN